MKVLVTGGAGYVGSHTVELLIEKGHDIIIIDNLSNSNQSAVHKKAKFYNLDLKEKNKIKKVFEENDIECVIHFAGSIEAGESMKNPKKFFENNVVATLNLLDIMLEKNVKKIIFSSTAAVYGEPEYVPIDEKHNLNPTNNYGLTKQIIEQVLQFYNKAYSLRYISLRYFNAAGASLSGKIGENHTPETHLIPLVLEVAKGKMEKFFVFGNDYNTKDGTCIRDYVHVSDLAEAHILAMEKIDKLKAGVFNLGNGKGFSVLEVIKACEQITKKQILVEITKRREGDSGVLIADYSKAKQVLNWNPKFDLNQIIQTAWNWQRNKTLR